MESYKALNTKKEETHKYLDCDQKHRSPHGARGGRRRYRPTSAGLRAFLLQACGQVTSKSSMAWEAESAQGARPRPPRRQRVPTWR